VRNRKRGIILSLLSFSPLEPKRKERKEGGGKKKRVEGGGNLLSPTVFF